MFSLAWDVQDLQTLVETRQLLSVELQVALDKLTDQGYNMPRHLGNIQAKMEEFLNKLYKFKRSPATHVFVVMISSDLRNTKPYALPVQCLPYAGMNIDTANSGNECSWNESKRFVFLQCELIIHVHIYY